MGVLCPMKSTFIILTFSGPSRSIYLSVRCLKKFSRNSGFLKYCCNCNIIFKSFFGAMSSLRLANMHHFHFLLFLGGKGTLQVMFREPRAISSDSWPLRTVVNMRAWPHILFRPYRARINQSHICCFLGAQGPWRVTSSRLKSCVVCWPNWDLCITLHEL